MSKSIKKKSNSAAAVAAAKKLNQAVVMNPKVEQVYRSIYFGYESTMPEVLKVLAVGAGLLHLHNPTEWVLIGLADEHGYRFKPESNSALVTLGYHPTAVLLWLTQMRLDGHVVVMAAHGKLYAQHAALAQCCRDVVFNYEKLAMVNGKPKVVATPILDNYRIHGKPKTFA